MKNFNKWFITFCEEKQVDMSEYCEGKNCTLQFGDVCSAILSAPEREQKIIKQTLFMIDFKNGSVDHYLKFLAKNLDESFKMSF